MIEAELTEPEQYNMIELLTDLVQAVSGVEVCVRVHYCYSP